MTPTAKDAPLLLLLVLVVDVSTARLPAPDVVVLLLLGLAAPLKYRLAPTAVVELSTLAVNSGSRPSERGHAGGHEIGQDNNETGW